MAAWVCAEKQVISTLFATAANLDKPRFLPPGLGSRPTSDEAFAKFEENLRGALISRSHPKYDEARKLYDHIVKRLFLIPRRGTPPGCHDIPSLEADLRTACFVRMTVATVGWESASASALSVEPPGLDQAIEHRLGRWEMFRL